MYTAKKIRFMYSPKRNSILISTFMYLWAIYKFPQLFHLFSCSRIGRPIVGIYKPLTETWMWQLGTRPLSFIFGNISFEFLVSCLGSVVPGVVTARNIHHVALVAAEWQATTGLHIPATNPIHHSICQAADDQNRSKKVKGGRGGGF